jgi:hypothetical protein
MLGLATSGDQLLNFILGPVDDLSYFCNAPDPGPVAHIGSSTVLQECSAGKTVTIKRGETVAVDLPNSYGVDTSDEWHDFSVSDQSVLGMVVAPTRRDTHSRSDEIAVYRALKSGQSTISAVLVHCGGHLGRCGRGHRWKTTVEVS